MKISTIGSFFLRFLTGLALLAILLAVRFPYMVDKPVLNFLNRGRIDPATLHLAGEFVESNLGTAQEADGSITVRMIAQQYNFVPSCVLVPIGTPLVFRITSADGVHMLSVSGTNLNFKVGPEAVTEGRFELKTPGQYPLVCHHYCGAGHDAMRSRLTAVPRDQFRSLKPTERVNCDAR
jgi:cytochrome c oxidase subunit 2